MAICGSTMLSLRCSASLKVKTEVEGYATGRSVRSLTGSSVRLGPSFLEGVGWRSSGGLLALSRRKEKRMDVNSRKGWSVVARSGKAEHEAEKPKPAPHLLLKLIPRLIPVMVIGGASWCMRRPGIALAGVDAPNYIVGGEAAQSGTLSREIARAGGGVVASAWTGLVAGGLHTLTGPDHLAALAPLCIGRSRVESFSVGALWGCGHDAGQMIFGLIFLLLKDRLHLDVIQTWAARVVGLTLITIGGMGIKEAQELEEATPVLAEGETAVEPSKKSVGPATFVTGIVYGLQPDALLMVLPALSLPSRAAGAAFLGMFLLGTVLAMGSYTAFVSSLSKALQKRVPKITHRLTLASSMVAIALGIAVLVGEVFGFNLF